MKELRVNAIKDGTVVDHLPARNIFKIVEILGLNLAQGEILIGSNLKSKRLGKKGVIKVSNITLDQKSIDAIALLAKEATISIIKNYEVSNKYTVKTPNEISGIVKCFNPNCITNNESAITRFTILQKEPLTLLCAYCEKNMSESDLAFVS